MPMKGRDHSVGVSEADRQYAAIALCLSPPLISLLASYTGGVTSPWLGLLYVPLALAGLMSLAAAALTAVWTIANLVIFAALVNDRMAATPVTIAAEGVSFFVVSMTVAFLVRRRADSRHEVDARIAATQIALDVEHMITAAYDLEMTLDLIMLKQREMLVADSYAVLLAEGPSLRVRVGGGLAAGAMAARFPTHADDHGWRPSGGAPQVVADTHLTKTRFSELDPLARSILLVPMHGVERVVGFLFFGSRTPDSFSKSDVDRAVSFADNIVFAVQRALLEDELKRLAYTDAQTSLFNHRHFQGQLDEEVNRAQRYGRSVSLILLDIDSFKLFNDTYGHPAGDRVLAEMAEVVRADLRTVDIAARYGGEEFVVICPETQRGQAMVLAERLCNRIASTGFVTEGGIAHQVTVSMGVAAYPADAASKGDLVDAADKALYNAKRTGKNRVVAYEQP